MLFFDLEIYGVEEFQNQLYTKYPLVELCIRMAIFDEPASEAGIE